MKRADRVHLKAPGTDLTFSIKGIGAKMCKGDRNIPDGEVFSCPVKNSVNGMIQFNTPTIYSGTKFENVRLEFKDGKIIKATANNTKRLNEILDTDAGARYVGEFSLGFNPYILNPMCDILFDEKIAGSLHFTPGQAYEECDNGNRSRRALGHGADPAQGMGRRRSVVRRRTDPQRRHFPAQGFEAP